MRAALLAVALALTACGPHKIPGTEIDDTSDTRAILDVVSKYREAFEARNAAAILALADQSFRNDGGDPLDYKGLSTTLPARFSQLDDVRLDLSVRKVEIDKLTQDARVTYTWTASWTMPKLTSKRESQSEIKQMALKRSGEKDWKIVSGI
jgi:hypothetical protein